MRIFSNPDHVPLVERWNTGVIKAVQFLDTLPDYISSDDSPFKSIEEKVKKLIG